MMADLTRPTHYSSTTYIIYSILVCPAVHRMS